MAMNHKATPEQWANVEQAYEPTEISPGVFVEDRNTTFAACLLELRARVEALEATQHTHAEMARPARVEALEAAANSSAGLTSSAPDGSLVERVATAIEGTPDAGTDWSPEARAAIREVAAWLSQGSEGHLGSGAHWAGRLQQEAER